MNPLWQSLGGRVPKNLGFVTQEEDFSFANQLYTNRHAVRVACVDDLVAGVWRRYTPSVPGTSIEDFPVTQYSSGVDAVVLEGVFSNPSLVRDLLDKRTPAFYLPRLRSSQRGEAQLLGFVEKQLRAYDPSLSL